MLTSSKKAKGRRLQQQVCNDLLLYVYKNLHKDDVTSRSMGVNGTDIVLSPAARKVLNLSIECKNQEHLNAITIFDEHYKKYEKDDSIKLLVHKKNKTPALVTLLWEDFLKFVEITT